MDNVNFQFYSEHSWQTTSCQKLLGIFSPTVGRPIHKITFPGDNLCPVLLVAHSQEFKRPQTVESADVDGCHGVDHQPPVTTRK